MTFCWCRQTGLWQESSLTSCSLAARAVENQIYTVGANRTGSDKFGDYPAGMTSVFDCLGEEIRETRRNGHIYALLDKDHLKESRERFPFYKAADRFTIDPKPSR